MKHHALAIFLLFTACQKAPEPPVGIERVTWRLGFDTTRTTPEPGGWRVTTDAGYDVHVTQGVLTTWRLGLTPCLKRVGWSLIPAAYANHVEPLDPTSLLPHLAENLAQPVEAVLTLSVPRAAYCQGFWLASAPPPAQAGAGPRVSLQLHATWEKAGQKGELALETWMPDAKLAVVPGLETARGATSIVLTRQVGALLDGIDLSNAPTPAMAWTVLHRLVGDAKWRTQ